MRTITTYRIVDGKVTKYEYERRSSHLPYLSEAEDLPFQQTVLNAYRKVEQEGKLNHLSPEVKQRIRDVHSQVLEYGDYK